MNLNKMIQNGTKISGLKKRILAGTLSALMVLSGNIPTSYAIPAPDWGTAEAGEVEVSSNNPTVTVSGIMEIGLGANAQNHAIRFAKPKGSTSYTQYLAYSGSSSVLHTGSGPATLSKTLPNKLDQASPTYTSAEEAKFGPAPVWELVTSAAYAAMTPDEKTDVDERYEAYKEAFYKYAGNWNQPGLNLKSGATVNDGPPNEGFVNFTPVDGTSSQSGVKTALFENGKYKSYKNDTKNYVIQRGQVRGNDKLYAEFIEEAIYAQNPTPDGYLDEEASGVNLITKVTNISDDTAQIYTQHWGVDTQIGRDDQAAFRGEGINRFFSGTRTVNGHPTATGGTLVNQGMVAAFPISTTMAVNGSTSQAADPWFQRATSPAINMFAGGTYDKDKIPGFL